MLQKKSGCLLIVCIFLSFNLFADKYNFVLKNGVEISLETPSGVTIESLIINHGGLFVNDFESIQLVYTDEALYSVDNECQAVSSVLYQLALEFFIFQQPYEIFIQEAPEEPHNSERTSSVLACGAGSMQECNIQCLFRCGMSFTSRHKRSFHYTEKHSDDLKKIRDKCNSGFSCELCTFKNKWRITSLRDLANHIRNFHGGNGYLDFLP